MRVDKYLTNILRERVGYEMINNQLGAELVMTIGRRAGGAGEGGEASAVVTESCFY